jgi:hypothetical protein
MNTMNNEKPLVYLAGPYSAKFSDGTTDESTMEARFQALTLAAAKLMQKGAIVFSPISHCHPMKKLATLPGDWGFWGRFDRAYLSCAHKMLVLKLEGWETSVGVNAERKIAEELGIPIEFVDPEDL